ncbi:MAG TPA: hypothetical protein PK191_05305 [Niabella sp.]|nr:hypothetical protein [Niabella sp.]HOZ97540.1 hypothetical protein [Niabella sp.]HQW15628.1 hypothetical protein [Niabella sp.]HQX20771.1 hypothetical protein [Niabella sp.]HQX41370.1 hypothetical protein [Niabella sp.]
MKESNDDFLQHIKTTLRNHEEPYEEGAWEHFAKSQNSPVKKLGILAFWKWAAAAAILVGGLFWFINQPQKPLVDHSATVATQEKENKNSSIPDKNFDLSNEFNKNDETARLTDVINQTGGISLANDSHKKRNEVISPSYIKQLPQLNKNNMQLGDTQSNFVHSDKVGIQKPEPEKREEAIIAQNNTIASNAQQEKIISKPDAGNPITQTTYAKTTASHKEKNNRWQPGLYISPLMSDEGLNLGYGLSVSFAVNDKVKIRSGIAHTKVSASRSFQDANGTLDAPGTFAESKTEARATTNNIVNSQQTSVLQQVNGSISGIDIPMELNYMLTKKWYATAGVSGLIVLDDNKNYTYLDSRNVKISVQTNKGTIKEDKSIQLSNSYETSQAQLPVSNEATPFLGFYNFSLGYKQKIFNKNEVSIEPFIKVPMSTNNQHNLNYTGTGIRLRFDF